MNQLLDRMKRAAKLDSLLYEEVEHDPSATGQAMAVVLIASVCIGLGFPLGGGLVQAAVSGLMALVFWLIWSGVIYLVGTKLFPEPQTEADYGQLLRTIGFAAAPGALGLLAFVPVLGWLLSLVLPVWILAATIVAVRQALDFRSLGRAILVTVVGWFLMMAISLVLGPLSLF